jgi:hypothetical protein
VWVGCQVGRQKLQRDLATEGLVFRSIDRAHPALTQFGEDAIVRDGLADHDISAREKYRRMGPRACLPERARRAPDGMTNDRRGHS